MSSTNISTSTELDHTKFKEIDLICSICRQAYFHPRVLDCLHSFCEDCIANNLTNIGNEGSSKSLIKCFLCSEITEIPEDDVSMLPYNFFANNAMDYLLIQCTKDNAILCTSCVDNSEAISRCSDCSEFLCTKCVTAHRRIRLTKEHKVVLLDTLRYDKTSVHRPVYCPDHEPEIFIYHCEVCKDLICKECTILQHRGHKYESLKEALEAQKPALLNLMEENEKDRVPPVDKAVDEVQDMAARLHARAVATKQAIRQSAENSVRAIESRCDELLINIDDLYKQKSKILHDQQKELQLRLMKNKSATDFISYAFKNGTEAEIFELLDVMKTRLTKLNSEPFSYKEPEENDVIDYIHNHEDIENIADNLGKLSTSRIFLSYTKLHGPGLHSGKVGIETCFIVEVFERDGQPCVESTNDESIRAKIQAPESFYINNKIQNNGNGTYTIRYKPVTKGKHDVCVKIRGKNFPNNQFVVRVYDGIDYRTIDALYLKFGSVGSKVAELKQPWGIAVNDEGHMYVTDHGNHRVQAYDKFGVFIMEFGFKGTKDGQFLGPTGIATDKNGVLYVADWDNHRIQIFNSDGTFVGKFGTRGNGFGQLYHPAGLGIDKSCNIVVAERDNNRLQLFSGDGKPILIIGSHGSTSALLNSPTHLAIREDNTYLIADAGNNRIVCLDHNGKYHAEFGSKGAGQGAGQGQFNRPSGIAVDREGYVIVADFHNHRIQIFDPNFKFFNEFGKQGFSDLEFKHPSGLSLTPEGHLAIVDRYNHRVQLV